MAGMMERETAAGSTARRAAPPVSSAPPVSPASPASQPPIIEVPSAAAGGAAQRFYDNVGWVVDEAGVPDDTRRFGNRETGELRDAAHCVRVRRIRAALDEAALPGRRISLIECGCGGNPASSLLDLCGEYTGVDFSTTGLELAQRRLRAAGMRAARLVRADLRALPFADGSFDAAYSAHVIYHIPTKAEQAAALAEIMRVVRPGGVAVLVLANPRPLISPLRCAKRLVADAPGLGALIRALRPAPPLPYLPLSLRWMKKRLAPHGEVEIITYAVASMWFNQHVSEKSALGRLAWRTIDWLEDRHPRAAARIGNYVTIIVRKTGIDPRLGHVR